MINAQQDFVDYLGEPGRTPIYGVALHDGRLLSDGSIAGATNITRIVTSQPPNGDFRGASETLQVRSMRRLADPSEGRLELSEFHFRWFDENFEATMEIGSILDRLCVVYSGFQGLDGIDFIVLFHGVVTDAYVETTAGGFYDIKAQSILSRAGGKRLFEGGRTGLVNTWSATAVDNLILEDCSGWQIPGTIRIEDELITYLDLTQTEEGWFVGRVTRGVYGTEAVEHLSARSAQEVFRIGPSHVVQSFQDVLGGTRSTKTKMGLGSWIDTTELNALETKLDGLYQTAWTVHAAQGAQDWLEKEICVPLSAYMIENNHGLISLKLIDAPQEADIVDTLSDTDIIRRPKWLGDYEERVNRVFVTYDTTGEPRLGEQTATHEFTDEGLIAESGDRLWDYFIEADAIGGSDSTDLLTEPPRRRIDRFGIAIPVIEAVTGMDQQRIELGDTVVILFTGVPRIEQQDREGNLAAEVIGMKYDFDNGTITWKLLVHASSIIYGYGAFDLETSLLLG